MKKHIVFFEAVGGSDKGKDGHRKDTVPMMDYLKKLVGTQRLSFLQTRFYAMRQKRMKSMSMLKSLLMRMFHA